MKRVAIVASGWKKLINYGWISGFKQYIKDSGAEISLLFFHSFGNFSKDEKYNDGENNIFNLPNLEEYDGIILELTNVLEPAVYQRIVEKVKVANVPTVSLVTEIPGFYCSRISNYDAMYKIVEHLVEHHHVKTINYVGGPIENGENQERLRAYKDVLIKHNIPVEEKRIVHETFELPTGEHAFYHFQTVGLLPEAFVCANDNIAVGLCYEASKNGYVVPRDFLVTGFDNFDKASVYEPRITTAGFTREEISYNALELLAKIWNGEQVGPYVYADVDYNFQESCGCVVKRSDERANYVINHIFREEKDGMMHNFLLDLKRSLINCESFDDLNSCLPKSITNLSIDTFYLYMNDSIINVHNELAMEKEQKEEYITEGYPEKMQLVFAMADNELKVRNHTEKGALLPAEEIEKPGDVYLYSPLHFREREAGYIVTKNCDECMDSQVIFEILNVFLETIENMYNHIVLKRMNEELSKLYMMDSLTGVYNRMAYNYKAIPLFEQCREERVHLVVMFVDVNRLKYINDNYGHDMGNLAIKAIVSAIEQSVPKDGIVLRYGGDEFVVLIPDSDDEKVKRLMEQINEKIQATKQKENVPFEISASMGYVITDESKKTLNDYINEADEKMYEVKKKSR